MYMAFQGTDKQEDHVQTEAITNEMFSPSATNILTHFHDR